MVRPVCATPGSQVHCSILREQFCSQGYFTSKNCMRELTAATALSKPLITLLEMETNKGGLTLLEIQQLLEDADGLYAKWGFGAGVPRSHTLYAHLYQHPPIEWNRIGHFQDCTMRLIAQRLLPADSGEVFVDREIINQPLRPLMAPSLGCTHHVYCSVLNPGANELVKELANKVGWQVDTQGLQVDEPTRGSLHRDSHHQESRRKSSMRSSVSGLLASRKQGGVLYVTSDVAKMQACEHVLIYLTSQTWTRGELSEQLGAEINQAMDLELSIKLAHEMPGLGGQHSRHGCEFGTFFASPNGVCAREARTRAPLCAPSLLYRWRGFACATHRSQRRCTNAAPNAAPPSLSSRVRASRHA